LRDKEDEPMGEPRRLYSLEFIAVTVIMLFAFLNIAVFYSFYSYLGRIGVPALWKGFLLGLEPMAAFLLRPLVVSRLHAGNAPDWMAASLVMLVLALVSYQYVVSVPGIAAVRIVHGAAFVLLVSAAFTVVVNFIPRQRSAEGFSVISLATLIPYAVMPPVTEYLLGRVESEAAIYAGVAFLALPAAVLLLCVRKRLLAAAEAAGAVLSRPTLADVEESFRNRDIVLLFGINFFIYISHATVFFFMKDFALAAGTRNVGAFFTIYTAVMIAVRLLGSRIFDRLDKLRALSSAMAALVACLLALRFVSSENLFYVLAAVYGLCVGVGIPMLNAALFDASPPRHRGLNTNIALFMMDGGFFLGPYLGGALIAMGWPVSSTILCCVFFVAIGCCLSVTAAGRASGRAEAPR
jgi:predicted MFS family arabinose efflux permease